MQTLKTTLLSYGALLLAHLSLIPAYFLLRRRARKTSPDRPILQLTWWKSFLKYLCAILLFGALAWIIGLAVLFAHFASGINRICLTHLTDEACARAIPQWRSLSFTAIEVSVLATLIIISSTYSESKRTSAPPEHSYPVGILTFSYGLLMTCYFLCTPLAYSLKVFRLQGTDSWIASSYSFTLVAILVYILGSTLWINATMRVFFACLRKRMDRSSSEERGTDRGRGFVLEDMYP